MAAIIHTTQKAATDVLHTVEGGFAHIEQTAADTYRKIEKNLPKPVADAMRHVSKNPTHMTGFLFLIGDVLMGAAGFFSKGKGTEHRNYLKMLSSGFGIANSYIWMTANDPDPAKRTEYVNAKVDQALAFVSVDESGAVHSGGVKAKLSTVAEKIAHDPVSFGGNLNAAGSVPMTLSGLRKGNVGEVLNGALSIFNYTILNLTGVVEKPADGTDAEAPKPLLGRVFKKLSDLPSRISGSIDYVTSVVGFLGGLQDTVGNKVPRIAGIFQMMASSMYLFGGWFMTRMSGHQNALLDAKTITADKPGDAKAVFDHAITTLVQSGKLSEKNAPLVLQAAAETLAQVPSIALDVANANKLRSRNIEENKALILSGLESSFAAVQATR
jgi:hypothetical protein